jgi:hypothetical protein
MIRVAPIPTSTGITRSISTTSGAEVRHDSTASAPLPTVATTSRSACAPITPASPSRTTP